MSEIAEKWFVRKHNLATIWKKFRKVKHLKQIHRMEEYLNDSKRLKKKEIKKELHASFLDLSARNIAVDDHALIMEAKRLAELKNYRDFQVGEQIKGKFFGGTAHAVSWQCFDARIVCIIVASTTR
ncbi:hypothetical protein L596_003954 [Steinernema carpocapsae]|uniref:Uncharacterized protein n=1 Tax=Steinernema carpocapsae TaxID=34508 RepID=A0A4U8UU27_STECR|nr:hypothetical protein L596_003954 [Steinernema carpocapsae]